MPNTFREAAGELTPGPDDDIFTERRKPRRIGLILGAVAAFVAAALAAYLITKPTASDGSTAAAPPPAEPAKPQVFPLKVKLSFKSEPAGAAVLRKDTNEQLGVTPFALELPASEAPIDFLFKKDTYREKLESYIPKESGQIAVALLANPAPPSEVPATRPEPKPETGSKQNAAARHRPAAPGGRRRAGHTMDEDGVLAPSF